MSGPRSPLKALTVKELKGRCKQAGLKSYSKLTRDDLVARLGNAAPPSTSGATGSPGLEQGLDRIETLLRRIAERLGLTPEEIERVAGDLRPAGTGPEEPGFQASLVSWRNQNSLVNEAIGS